MKQTSLVFEGMAPDEVTEAFLVEVMDVCEEHGLDVAGISVDRQESWQKEGEQDDFAETIRSDGDCLAPETGTGRNPSPPPMTKSVNVEVYCSTSGGEREVFAVLSEHRPDLPTPFDSKLQEWARERYSHLEPGAEIDRAGELVYQPFGEIVEIRKLD